MTEGILGGAGLIDGGLAAYKAIKGMQTVNKMKNDASSQAQDLDQVDFKIEQIELTS